MLPGVWMVTGSMSIGPTTFSRNMQVLKQGDELVLVNTVRLDDAGLEALDALGRVTHVVRLAGFPRRRTVRLRARVHLAVATTLRRPF